MTSSSAAWSPAVIPSDRCGAWSNGTCGLKRPAEANAGASCTSVTDTAAPTTVASGSGAHVTITAVATGCTNSARYEFWLRPASSGTWQLVQGYGTSATYDWNSTGAAAGVVYLGVHVRDANSGASYDAVASTPVTVT